MLTERASESIYPAGPERLPPAPRRVAWTARARWFRTAAWTGLLFVPNLILAWGWEAGADLPIALAEQIEAARLLEHGITKERLPFVYGWHRLAVTAPDRELCVRRAEAVTEHYRDIGIDVVNSTGDQFSLLCE